MKLFKHLMWGASALLLLAPMSYAAPSADEAAVHALSTNWLKAYNGGDVAGVVGLYADDALLMPPGAPGMKGKAAIQAYFTKDMADSKSGGMVLSIGAKTDVGVTGDMGWESGTYSATVKGAVVETGKYLSVAAKKDGKWHFIRDTWNSDAPPPAAASAPAAPKKK
jgi:uncharacterized protein (TIGR02246 family)